jgi:hypothetical protein
MKVLFLDDSFQRKANFLGYGGFSIDESEISTLIGDIIALKSEFRIPRWVDLKWSPKPRHFLRSKFTGDRQELNRKIISLLHKHKATIICAVHDLNDCYGVRLYNWNFERTRLWATKQQFKFIAERFETPYLSASGDSGLVIADHYSDIEGEKSLIREASVALEYGTDFRVFQKICMPPLTATPSDCPPLQVADITVGIIVASLARNRYGLELFEDVATLLLKNPHEGAISFASVLSSAVLGFGLTLFPKSFRLKGIDIFEELDQKYVYTHEGLELKTISDKGSK